MSIKCYNVVSEMVRIATDKLGTLWQVNEEKMNILQQYCEALDNILSECDGESIEVDIDEDSKNIKITIGCPEIVIYGQPHRFYELSERAFSITFETSENFECVYISFVFPGVWDLTNADHNRK